jgi:hypothetical protein
MILREKELKYLLHGAIQFGSQLMKEIYDGGISTAKKPKEWVDEIIKKLRDDQMSKIRYTIMTHTLNEMGDPIDMERISTADFNEARDFFDKRKPKSEEK